jgi:hypothetical protein
MEIRKNFWLVRNFIDSAGSLEEFEKRAKNLQIKVKNETGGFLTKDQIINNLYSYFDKLSLNKHRFSKQG